MLQHGDVIDLLADNYAGYGPLAFVLRGVVLWLEPVSEPDRYPQCDYLPFAGGISAIVVPMTDLVVTADIGDNIMALRTPDNTGLWVRVLTGGQSDT